VSCALYSLVADGDALSFGRLHFTAHHTPAHTSGHVVYMLEGTPFHTQNSLFSGDLLFIGGAGLWFCSIARSTLLTNDPANWKYTVI